MKLSSILSKLNVIEFVGSKDQEVNGLAAINDLNPQQGLLSWVNDKNLGALSTLVHRTVICSAKADRSLFKKDCNYIIVEKPRNEFRKVLEMFYVAEDFGISSTAFVDNSAKIGNNVSIGPHAVIEAEVVIGEGSIIGANTVVKRRTVIGKNVKIGSNNVIGGMGFGYEKDESGEYVFIPHIGNVVIADNVEIGNCTAIDRAVIGSTLIGENCKIDNLVHIAHGVTIGRNSLIIANAMVAGSVRVGESTWVAPSSSILNGKSIGNNALIGLGAVVLKDVADGEIWIGNPAKPLRKVGTNS